MKTNLESAVRATFAASALLISVLIVGSAISDERDIANAFAGSPVNDVTTADLNLETEEGLVALYGRVNAAARQVCGAQGDAATNRECIGDAEARVIQHLNVSALSDYYQERTGRGASILVSKAQ